MQHSLLRLLQARTSSLVAAGQCTATPPPQTHNLLKSLGITPETSRQDLGRILAGGASQAGASPLPPSLVARRRDAMYQAVLGELAAQAGMAANSAFSSPLTAAAPSRPADVVHQQGYSYRANLSDRHSVLNLELYREGEPDPLSLRLEAKGQSDLSSTPPAGFRLRSGLNPRIMATNIVANGTLFSNQVTDKNLLRCEYEGEPGGIYEGCKITVYVSVQSLKSSSVKLREVVGLEVSGGSQAVLNPWQNEFKAGGCRIIQTASGYEALYAGRQVARFTADAEGSITLDPSCANHVDIQPDPLGREHRYLLTVEGDGAFEMTRREDGQYALGLPAARLVKEGLESEWSCQIDAGPIQVHHDLADGFRVAWSDGASGQRSPISQHRFSRGCQLIRILGHAYMIYKLDAQTLIVQEIAVDLIRAYKRGNTVLEEPDIFLTKAHVTHERPGKNLITFIDPVLDELVQVLVPSMDLSDYPDEVAIPIEGERVKGVIGGTAEADVTAVLRYHPWYPESMVHPDGTSHALVQIAGELHVVTTYFDIGDSGWSQVAPLTRFEMADVSLTPGTLGKTALTFNDPINSTQVTVAVAALPNLSDVVDGAAASLVSDVLVRMVSADEVGAGNLGLYFRSEQPEVLSVEGLARYQLIRDKDRWRVLVTADSDDLTGWQKVGEEAFSFALPVNPRVAGEGRVAFQVDDTLGDEEFSLNLPQLPNRGDQTQNQPLAVSLEDLRVYFSAAESDRPILYTSEDEPGVIWSSFGIRYHFEVQSGRWHMVATEDIEDRSLAWQVVPAVPYAEIFPVKLLREDPKPAVVEAATDAGTDQRDDEHDQDEQGIVVHDVGGTGLSEARIEALVRKAVGRGLDGNAVRAALKYPTQGANLIGLSSQLGVALNAGRVPAVAFLRGLGLEVEAEEAIEARVVNRRSVYDAAAPFPADQEFRTTPHQIRKATLESLVTGKPANITLELRHKPGGGKAVKYTVTVPILYDRESRMVVIANGRVNYTVDGKVHPAVVVQDKKDPQLGAFHVGNGFHYHINITGPFIFVQTYDGGKLSVLCMEPGPNTPQQQWLKAHHAHGAENLEHYSGLQNLGTQAFSNLWQTTREPVEANGVFYMGVGFNEGHDWLDLGLTREGDRWTLGDGNPLPYRFRANWLQDDEVTGEFNLDVRRVGNFEFIDLPALNTYLMLDRRTGRVVPAPVGYFEQFPDLNYPSVEAWEEKHFERYFALRTRLRQFKEDFPGK
jgi:hypothetical protein